MDQEKDLDVFRTLGVQQYQFHLDVRANSKLPFQRVLSAKSVFRSGQVSSYRLRKDQQAGDEEFDDKKKINFPQFTCFHFHLEMTQNPGLLYCTGLPC